MQLMPITFLIGAYDVFYCPGTGTFLIIAFSVFARMSVSAANAQMYENSTPGHPERTVPFAAEADF